MEWIDDPLRSARSEIFANRGEPDPTAVELDLENVDVAQVYLLTRNQTLQSGDISIPAVKIIMDLYGVKDQINCLKRVRGLFYHFMEAKADEGGSVES